jgi:hypothetical protein
MGFLLAALTLFGFYFNAWLGVGLVVIDGVYLWHWLVENY